MKMIIIIGIIMLHITSMSAQKPIEIQSFDYYITYENPEWRTEKWYIIDVSLKCDDGSIIQKHDSIYYLNPKLKEIINSNYSINKDDYYKVDIHFNYEGLSKNESDSLLLYIPIEKIDADNFTQLVFSNELKQMSEPKYFNSNNLCNALRITLMHNDRSEIYRLEKISNHIKLTHKKLIYKNKKPILKLDTSFIITKRRYQKYFRSIFETNILPREDLNNTLPYDILIEFVTHNSFEYKLTKSLQLKHYDKKTYKCIKRLRECAVH